MEETWVESLGQENPMENEMAIHSSIPAGKFPRWRSLECPWGHRVRHDWATEPQQLLPCTLEPVIMSPVF